MSEQGGAGVVENTHFSLPVRGEEAEEEYKILIPLYQSESMGGGHIKNINSYIYLSDFVHHRI